jgi:cell division protein FtsQ
MNAWFKLLFLLSALILSVLCFVKAQIAFSRRPYQEIVVAIFPAETPFITADTVNKLLIQKMKSSTATLKEGIALNEVENQLKAHKMVFNAELYSTISGKLVAEIVQREPVVKVVGKEVFYIDSNAQKMPLSPTYTASVPVIKGDVVNEYFAEVRDAIAFLKAHPLYGDDLIGLVEVRDSWYQLLLGSQSIEIELGDLKKLEAKMNNYAAFMIKTEKDDIVERYRKISLAFDGQVVCTKI